MNGLGRNNTEKEKKQSVFTKETLGVVLILFATLCLVCLITRETVFYVFGQYVNAFLFGCFGFFAYGVVIWLIVMGVILVTGKTTNISAKRKTLITVAFSLIALISHIATMTGQVYSGYGEYLFASYMMGQGGIATTSAGGLFTGLVAFLFSSLLTNVGSYVVLGLGIAGVIYVFVRDYLKENEKQKAAAESDKFRSSFVKSEDPVISTGLDIEGEREYPVSGVTFPSAQAKQKLFVNNPNDFTVKNKRELSKGKDTPQIKLGFSDGGLGVVTSYQEEKKAATYAEDYSKKLEYIKTPAAINVDKIFSSSTFEQVKKEEQSTVVSDYVEPREVKSEEPVVEHQSEIPHLEHDGDSISIDDSARRHAVAFEHFANVPETDDKEIVEVQPSEVFRPLENTFKQEEAKVEEDFTAPIVDEAPKMEEPFTPPFIEETNEEPIVEDKTEDLPSPTVMGSRRVRNIFFEEEKPTEEQPKTEKPVESIGFTSRVSADDNLGARRGLAVESEKQEEEKPKKVAPPINREYFRPPFDLLETYAPPADMPKENHEERMEIIQQTLEDFKINAVPQSYIQGPSITRYEITMPAGISVKRVLNYDDDLKMRLAARDGVRIQAPIPGKNLVGIEVANTVRVTVGLREVLEGLQGQKSKDGSMIFVLGEDLVGKPITDDISKGPHYLVAGATGSGKSVCLNVMIVSLIMRYSPEELRLILVDPKSVEFMNYEHIPHLMTDEIITEPKKALAVLNWAYQEMERRFSVFHDSQPAVVNIDDYNEKFASDTVARMPKIVIIIDELADLMETCKKDLETAIRKLAAKARAAGIHLVLATQRPSVDVITGTIKANLPSRIAFKVTNFNDSQTILSEGGAEKLLGNGDMLYKNSKMNDFERYQGAYISSREVNNIVNYIKEHNTAYFDDELAEYLEKETKPKQEETTVEAGGGDDENELSEFFLKALWLAVNTETVSISQLQRRFQIGYARAGGLVDKMERMGFVSGNEGSKARRVLLSKEEFESRFGSVPDSF